MAPKELKALIPEILGMLTRDGHTIKSMLFELLRTYVHTDDHILCALLDELWAKGIRYSEIKLWSTRKAEELYGGELRSLTSSTRGLHVSGRDTGGGAEDMWSGTHGPIHRCSVPHQQ